MSCETEGERFLRELNQLHELMRECEPIILRDILQRTKAAIGSGDIMKIRSLYQEMKEFQ